MTAPVQSTWVPATEVAGTAFAGNGGGYVPPPALGTTSSTRRPRRLDARTVKRAARGAAVRSDVPGTICFSVDYSASVRGDKPDTAEVASEAVYLALEVQAATDGRKRWSAGMWGFDLAPAMAPVRLDHAGLRTAEAAFLADQPMGCSTLNPSMVAVANALRAAQEAGPTVAVAVTDFEIYPEDPDRFDGLVTCEADVRLGIVLGGNIPPELTAAEVTWLPVHGTDDPSILAVGLVQAMAEAGDRWKAARQ